MAGQKKACPSERNQGNVARGKIFRSGALTRTKKTGTIDYYYSVRSNYAYIGAARLNALARRFNRTIVHRPILLCVTMPPIGGVPFSERPPMLRAYHMRDAVRCAEALGIEILREPVHHVGPLELPSETIIVAQRRAVGGSSGDIDQFSLSVHQALWRDDEDIANEDVLIRLCAGAGFDEPDAIVREAMRGEAQAELDRNNREAIVRGVIGAPTYFVDDEPFFGQDRLDHVEQALAMADTGRARTRGRG